MKNIVAVFTVAGIIALFLLLPYPIGYVVNVILVKLGWAKMIDNFYYTWALGFIFMTVLRFIKIRIKL